MPATLATIDPLLKEVYRGSLREQLNQEIVALKRIQSSNVGITNEIGGRYVTFPIHVTRNSGIGSRFEGEALPVPGQQGMAAARVGLKYAYGAVQLTGQAIALTDSNPQAFAKALDLEMSTLKQDLLKDMNRQVYGVGAGTIATLNDTAASATHVVLDARLLQVGAKVDVIRLSSGAYSSTISTNNTVNSVTLSTNTVVFQTTFTPAVGDIIVRAGSGIAAAGNRELTGLAAIIAGSGALFNINPSTVPEWTSEVNSNSGTARPLSEGLMIQMVDRIRIRGGKTTLILQSLGVRRSYFNLLSQTRSTVNTQSFTGGFTGLAFTTDGGELPVVSDPDAPLNTQWFVNEEALTYYRESEWDWMDRDGSIWKQNVDASGRYDSWVAYLEEYHELGTDRRNTHGAIFDIQES